MGTLLLCLNRAACSSAEGVGTGAGQTSVFTGRLWGEGREAGASWPSRGQALGGVGGAALTGDVQVGVGLDLPARVAGQALEDP